MAHVHREPYITLAGLTETSALITWGAFFFDVDSEQLDGRYKIVEDKDLAFLVPPRKTTIGESSEPYGPTTVRVWEKGGGQPVEVTVTPQPGEKINHAWVEGLRPDTVYQYSVKVNGNPWAEEERRDWVVKGSVQGMMLNKGVYENEFRTYPAADQPTPDFAFAVIGDFGQGVKDASTNTSRQREISNALARAVRDKGVRFVLTTGDNIYNGGGSDSDWFFTYYQPYRYVLNRVPVYPSCGNHDEGESEFSDDYDELLDNFYIRQRFLSGNFDEGDALKDKGLFYSFNFGRDFEFVAIDSAKPRRDKHQAPGQPPPPPNPRAFERDENLDFIKESIPDLQGAPPSVWRVPFFHHPAYCYGPLHPHTQEVIDKLVPVFERGGVRLVLSGHEHNLQIRTLNRISYVLTGGAGEVRPGALDAAAKTDGVAWSPKPHFLLCEYKAGALTVTPYGELAGGKLKPLAGVKDPQGQPFKLPPLSLA